MGCYDPFGCPGPALPWPCVATGMVGVQGHVIDSDCRAYSDNIWTELRVNQMSLQ